MANRSDNSQAPIDISEKKGYKVDIPLLFCAVLNESYKLENRTSLEQKTVLRNSSLTATVDTYCQPWDFVTGRMKL